MAEQATKVDKLSLWNHLLVDKWCKDLPKLLQNNGSIAIEPFNMPHVVKSYLNSLLDLQICKHISPILAYMRIVKS